VGGPWGLACRNASTTTLRSPRVLSLEQRWWVTAEGTHAFTKKETCDRNADMVMLLDNVECV